MSAGALMKMEKLKNTWWILASGYSNDEDVIEHLWSEIQTYHSAVNRFYHNLHHLVFMLEKAESFKRNIICFDTFLFSIFYHDIIYDINRQDNEYQSSLKARECMTNLGVPEEQISKCMDQILATKDHEERKDPDTNLFTDIDLAILGEEWNVYEDYTKKIRLEYSIYPGDIYNSGRINVLKHFLDMEKIYKTSEFYNRCEKRARVNLEKEIELLSFET